MEIFTLNLCASCVCISDRIKVTIVSVDKTMILEIKVMKNKLSCPDMKSERLFLLIAFFHKQ